MDYCYNKPCVELRHKLDLYLMKSELLRYLREEHGRWWSSYEKLYRKGTWRSSPESSRTVEYSERAKEVLTRCRMLDTLFTSLLPMDLLAVDGFGHYCKLVFLEINRLQPAFPDSASSVTVFDEIVRELRKFVMLQNERWATQQETQPAGPVAVSGNGRK